jgi:hypothetical protein
VTFEQARKVADAVLFEGYVLYPYRASAQKNQARWQFGVLVPRAWSQARSGEPWSSQTECLVEPGPAGTGGGGGSGGTGTGDGGGTGDTGTDGAAGTGGGGGAVLEARVRFLRLQARTVADAAGRPLASLEVDGTMLPAWDEGVEEEAGVEVPLAELLAGERVVPIELPGGREEEPVRDGAGVVRGRVARERWPLSARLTLAAERLEGPYGLVRLRVRTENLTPWEGAGTAVAGGDRPGSVSPPGAERDLALRRSLAGAHTLLAVGGGAFTASTRT